MSKYELWAKHKDKSFYELICEFDNPNEAMYRVDEIIATGEYVEATVLREHKYIYGKESKKGKVKKK